MALSTNVIYDIVAAALIGVFITPLFILWIIALCTAKRSEDPARTGISWLKAVYPLWILSLSLRVITTGIDAYMWVLSDSPASFYTYESTWYHLTETQIRIGNTAGFCSMISDVLLLIALVHLGCGFLYCHYGSQTTSQKIIRYTVFGYGFLLIVIGLSWYAFNLALWTPYFNYQYASIGKTSSAKYTVEYDLILDTLNDKLKVQRQLVGAYDILHWIATIPVVVMGSIIVHLVRANVLLHNSAILLLVSAVLDFFRSTWNMAYDATWLLPTLPDYTPQYVTILDPILGIWPVFVLLVLLFVLAIRKPAGLWSNQQSWNSNGVHVAGTPGRHGQPISQQQQHWQMQPQQQQYQQYQQQYPQNSYAPQYYQQVPQGAVPQYHPGTVPVTEPK